LFSRASLALDASILGTILTDYKSAPGPNHEPQPAADHSVLHLLEHTGGWDRSTTQRSMARPNERLDSLLAPAAQALGHAAPATDAEF
jgi:hypothetical protein